MKCGNFNTQINQFENLIKNEEDKVIPIKRKKYRNFIKNTAS